MLTVTITLPDGTVATWAIDAPADALIDTLTDTVEAVLGQCPDITT